MKTAKILSLVSMMFGFAGCSSFERKPAPVLGALELSAEYPATNARAIAGGPTSSVFRCFSSAYTSQLSVLALAGKVDSDSRVSSFSFKAENLGLALTDRVLRVAPGSPSPSASARHKDYRRFPVGGNPLGSAFREVDVLFPVRLTEQRDRFEAYVSDATTARGETPGYFKVDCRML